MPSAHLVDIPELVTTYAPVDLRAQLLPQQHVGDPLRRTLDGGYIDGADLGVKRVFSLPLFGQRGQRSVAQTIVPVEHDAREVGLLGRRFQGPGVIAVGNIIDGLRRRIGSRPRRAAGHERQYDQQQGNPARHKRLRKSWEQRAARAATGSSKLRPSTRPRPSPTARAQS